jgi:hypothetical protein
VRLTAALSLAADGQAPPPEEVIRRLGLGAHETSLLTVMLLVEMAQTDLAERPRAARRQRDRADRARGHRRGAGAVRRLRRSAADRRAGDRGRPVGERAAALSRRAGAVPPSGGRARGAARARLARGGVRAAAAHAAGRIGVAAALDRLEQLLADADWWVRFQAAQALAQLGADGARRLHHAASHGAEPARETAALTLAEHAAAAP